MPDFMPRLRRLSWRSGSIAALVVAGLGSRGSFAEPANASAAPIAGVWEGELIEPTSWPTFVTVDVDSATLNSTLSVLGQRIELGRAQPDLLKAATGSGADQQVLTARLKGGELHGRLDGAGTHIAFALSRVPQLPKRTDRTSGWNADLTALERRVLRYDRSFSPAEKALVRRRIAALRPLIPSSSDDVMRVEIAKLLAMANNAHTRLYLLRNRTELGRLPVRVWWFGNQLRVIRAAPGHEALLGCRVAKVDGMATDAAYARVSAMYAGSAGWKRYMSGYTLTAPSVLAGNHIGKDATAATLELEDCASPGRHSLAALPLKRSEKALESWWDLAPNSPSLLQGWSQVLTGTVLPTYLRRISDAYWFDDGRSDGIFYLQLNRAANDGPESVKAFAGRAAAAILARNPKAIVVDIRFNTGGDSTVTKVLVDALAKAADKRPTYIIVAATTFSAGIVAAAQFKQFANAKIVGERVGDDLDFWAEGGNIILPYSGLAAHFANGAHSLSPKPCPTADFCDDLSVATLAPDVLAGLDWLNYRSGVDPSEVAWLADLRQHRTQDHARSR
jgi:hypothetical protein